MKRPKPAEVGIVAAGMVACCILTEVILAGAITAAIATIGGAIGLAVIAGLLLGALVFVRRRNATHCCTVAQPLVPAPQTANTKAEAGSAALAPNGPATPPPH